MSAKDLKVENSTEDLMADLEVPRYDKVEKSHDQTDLEKKDA